MVKKIENIADYISAQDAATILSKKMGRPIRPDYVSKMTKTRKHAIRTIRKSARMTLYHRADIEACTVLAKRY